MKHATLPPALPKSAYQRRGFIWIKTSGLLAALVVVTGGFLFHRQHQRQAVAALERLSPGLEFEYEFGDDWALDLSQFAEEWMGYEASLETLVGLDLRSRRTGDAHLVCLQGSTNLEWLDLSNTRVTDSGIAHLEGLENLDRLWLTNTEVTDAGLVHLQGLENLETLCLTGTGVTDAGLRELSGLRKLKWLNLSQTQVTEAGTRPLRGSLPFLHINR